MQVQRLTGRLAPIGLVVPLPLFVNPFVLCWLGLPGVVGALC